jgi:hypothetical protein
MPLNRRRVEAVFLEAALCDDPVDRAAVLERACSADRELRRRVEGLLLALDKINSLLNDPIVLERLAAARRNRLSSVNAWRARRRS